MRSDGDLELAGSVRKSGVLFLHNLGTDNTAVGLAALLNNNDGFDNTAMGTGALYANTTGSWNTAVGDYALTSVTGQFNTALGTHAGEFATTGRHNIYIANVGTDADSNLIRIGDINQDRTFVAGIRGVTTTNADAIPVIIDSAGQLGTASSSRRVKRDIEDMGDTTDTVLALHPVRFRYQAHGPDSPLQYGLIAEEVAEIAPDLVARNKDGEIETVYYDKVNAMLLNEVQKLHRRLAEPESRVK